MMAVESRPPTFPFLRLPLELRIMVYGLLMQPPDDNAVYVYTCRPNICPISTPMLYVNRQIHGEASAILYDQNTLNLEGVGPGSRPLIRTDRNVGLTRRLRSGRLMSTTKFTGEIYPHVLERFHKIRVTVWVSFCMLSSRHFNFVPPNLKEVFEVLRKRPVPKQATKCKDLVIEFHSCCYKHPPRSTQDDTPREEALRTALVKEGIIDTLRELQRTRKVEITGLLGYSGIKNITDSILQE
ncbi:hypothetical protein MMC24_004109 [Lignoscripta atroalba]|nr:hypothetical protein [Lignoscripta atroalba]